LRGTLDIDVHDELGRKRTIQQWALLSLACDSGKEGTQADKSTVKVNLWSNPTHVSFSSFVLLGECYKACACHLDPNGAREEERK